MVESVIFVIVKIVIMNKIKECYYKAINYCNNTFAESIDYGGYDSAEQFWDNLFG